MVGRTGRGRRNDGRTTRRIPRGQEAHASKTSIFGAASSLYLTRCNARIERWGSGHFAKHTRRKRTKKTPRPCAFEPERFANTSPTPPPLREHVLQRFNPVKHPACSQFEGSFPSFLAMRRSATLARRQDRQDRTLETARYTVSPTFLWSCHSVTRVL